MPVLIETERLRLRELQPQQDAACMLALLNDPAFSARLSNRDVLTLEQAVAYLHRWDGTQYARTGFGHYAVELREQGEFLGTAGLIQRADLALPDIGYGFFGRHHRRGYALEAARAVMAHAREVLGLPGLCGIVAPDNLASLRLMEKLGLQRHGYYTMASGSNPHVYFEIMF